MPILQYVILELLFFCTLERRQKNIYTICLCKSSGITCDIPLSFKRFVTICWQELL
jgi:hypothetical protein